MYEQYFGLNRNPFLMTPDPSALFMTPGHREALAGLYYGALSRKGFVVLTGEAGTGKTTLLGRLLELAEQAGAHCSVVFNPLLSPAEFLELLLAKFGVRDLPSSKALRLLKLEEMLIEIRRTGKTAVLVIDEAHKLTPHVFEEVRLLTNYETGQEKLLQIVLSGQPELKKVLRRPDLWQLNQRIAIRVHIDPLTRSEVESFIAYRWNRFGGKAPHPFSDSALAAITQFSQGIPRLINSICDNALLVGYSQDKREVESDEILQVVFDLDLPIPAPRLRPAESEKRQRKAAFTLPAHLDAKDSEEPAPAATLPDVPSNLTPVRPMTIEKPALVAVRRTSRPEPAQETEPAPALEMEQVVAVKKIPRYAAASPRNSFFWGLKSRFGL